MIKKFSKLISPEERWQHKTNSKPAARQKKPIANIQILLLDGSTQCSGQIKKSLQKLAIRYDLYVCSDATEALDMLKCKKHPIRLQAVILNIGMEDRQGIKLLKSLKADKSLEDLNVFILSESSAKASALMDKKFRISGCIIDPLTREPKTSVTRMDSFAVGYLRKFLLNAS